MGTVRGAAMKIKRTKHQRELYELAGEFFALMQKFGEAYGYSDGWNKLHALEMRALCCAREAIKLAESAK